MYLCNPDNNACLVELNALFEAFKALMGAEPLPVPNKHVALGVSTSESDDALKKDITLDELCSCIKRLKRQKNPGMHGILPDIIL